MKEQANLQFSKLLEIAKDIDENGTSGGDQQKRNIVIAGLVNTENEYLYKQYMEKFPTLNLPYNDYETAYRQVFSTPVYMRRAPQVQQAAGPNAPHGALRPNMQKPVIIPNSPQGAIQPANMVQRPMRPIYRLFCPVCGNEVRTNSFNCPVCKTPLNIKNYLD